MAHGRKTGGRQKGSQNKARKERIAAAAASGLLPHEFLLAVSRGESFDGHLPSFDQRMKAATDCASFYAPKLAAVEHTGKDGGAIETKDVSNLDRAKALAALVAMLKVGA